MIINNHTKMKQISFLIVCLLITLTSQTVVVNPISGVTTNNLMYTGTIQLTDSQEKLFFTFYGKDGETSPDNLQNNVLIIAVGAPGRSSSYINYGGIGPKLLNNDMTLANNPNSITKFANVMFLDLLGSGYSFATDSSKIPTTSSAVGAILTDALNIFYKQVAIGQSKTIYLIGESTFLRSLPGIDDFDPLSGIFHVSPWPDFYQVGKYYATAGIDTHIFGQTQRITIESTFSGCHFNQINKKYIDAHNCYQTILNYIEENTKNRNLLNIALQSNLTDFVPMVQYYLSQSQVVSTLKAPNQRLFESNSPKVQANLYEDMAKNYDKEISQFYKDYLPVKHIFIAADNDFIGYRKGIKDWLQNQITFVQSDKFQPLPLEEFKVNDKVVGFSKAVNQIKYFELLNSGHYSYNEVPAVINSIILSVVEATENRHKQLQFE